MGNLNKVVYTDHQTVITADNLNAIQDSIIQNTSYTTCSTGASTAAKTAALTNFVLTTGSAVRVKFTNTNTASNPTLNINSTGAKPIMKFGTTAAGTTATSSWESGEIVTFVYDGTNWLMADFSRLSSLGLGGINDNLWDNSVDILNVGTPRVNGGNFRVYGNANSYPLSLPTAISPAITGGEVVCYRQSFCQFTSSLTHATVVLYEVYPVAGRIWINTYNTSWGGWKEYRPTDGGSMGLYSGAFSLASGATKTLNTPANFKGILTTIPLTGTIDAWGLYGLTVQSQTPTPYKYYKVLISCGEITVQRSGSSAGDNIQIKNNGSYTVACLWTGNMEMTAS